MVFTTKIRTVFPPIFVYNVLKILWKYTLLIWFEWMLTSSSTCRSLLKRYFSAKVPIKKLGIRIPALLRSGTITADEKLASFVDVVGSWMSGLAHWTKNRRERKMLCVFTNFFSSDHYFHEFVFVNFKVSHILFFYKNLVKKVNPGKK